MQRLVCPYRIDGVTQFSPPTPPYPAPLKPCFKDMLRRSMGHITGEILTHPLLHVHVKKQRSILRVFLLDHIMSLSNASPASWNASSTAAQNAGPTSSRNRGASPPPHHEGSHGGAGGGRGSSDAAPRMLGVGSVLAPPEQSCAEDLSDDPLPWSESMGTGGPLFYSGLLRWQASALQVCVSKVNQ